MKITVLVENTSCADAFQPEHGLSLYVETGKHKILFDMGQTDAFAKNAEKLGIDLGLVDIAILSHGHYDHGGGLEKFLSINENAKIYIHKNAFGQYYNGTEKYIGLDLRLREDPRLQFTDGITTLAQDLILYDCNDEEWTFDSWGLTEKTNGNFLPDSFTHEQYLVIREGERQILISGCSHKGIVNIAEHFRPDVLIGGFHLNKQEDTAALTEVAGALLRCGGLYYTGHCTGNRQYEYLKAIMTERLHDLSTGKTWTI